jgi:hypothetical protein
MPLFKRIRTRYFRTMRARSRVTKAMLAVLTLVVVGVASAQPAFAATWTSPAGIPAADTNGGSPALASFHKELYAVWQGQSSPYHIWYSAYDGSTNTWSSETTVPSALTNYRTGPAAAVYNGDLYVAWLGQSSPIHIWYSAFNGSTWTTQAEVPSALVHISSTVGLASYKGKLYLAWTGESSPYAVYYSAFDGTSWTAQSSIPSSSSDNYQATDTPLTAFDGNLYASWETGSTNDLEYATFNGTSWSTPTSLGIESNAGPALAVKGKYLYESWINYSNLHVDYSSFNGTTWSATKSVPGASIIIETGPALTTWASSLVAAWDPDSSPSAIEYSFGTSLNGSAAFASPSASP